MIVIFVLAFALLHLLVIVLFPSRAMLPSYVFLTAAPLLAALAAWRRRRRGGASQRRSWNWIALSFVLWACGMALSARQDLLLDNTSASPGDSMLLYILYGVPIMFVLAGNGDRDESLLVRLTDALLVLTLGYLYFVFTFSLTGLHGTSDPAHTRMLILMFDYENVFLLAGALIRYNAAANPSERNFFGVLSLFLAVYLVVAAYNNHVIAVDPSIQVGALTDLILDVPFLVFIALSFWQRKVPRAWKAPSVQLVRYVSSGSPLLMALAVLIMAMFVLGVRFWLGIAGILIAVLCYGLRNTLTEVRHITAEEALRHDRSELEGLVWIDALTGIGNRRAFDRALEQELLRARRARQSLALLMIDIDHFKRLNDRYGHSYGDACLQKVARCLSEQVSRPADLIVRYGGEEFAMVLPDASAIGTQKLAEQVRAAIMRLNEPNEDSPFRILTVSIGVVISEPGVSVSAAHLVQAADAALYDAKRAGRNQVRTADQAQILPMVDGYKPSDPL